MSGYEVDPEDLRAHARSLDEFAGRFDAVQSASSHIAQDDEAYGLLCGWIAGILEGRHVRQDGLVEYLKENIELAAESIRAAADAYEETDNDASVAFDDFASQIGG